MDFSVIKYSTKTLCRELHYSKWTELNMKMIICILRVSEWRFLPEKWNKILLSLSKQIYLTSFVILIQNYSKLYQENCCIIYGIIWLCSYNWPWRSRTRTWFRFSPAGDPSSLKLWPFIPPYSGPSSIIILHCVN